MARLIITTLVEVYIATAAQIDANDTRAAVVKSIVSRYKYQLVFC